MKKSFAIFIMLFLAYSISFGQSKSFKSKLEKARQNNVDAQNEVGVAYSEGIGVKPSQKKAVYWFRKSAEAGYALATCNLGLHYWQGWGVPKDKVLMMKYVFAANTLDGLKCHPSDYIKGAKPTECQLEMAWNAAVAWLREHPNFKNNFKQQPWKKDVKEAGEYPINLRERSSTTAFPIKVKKKCG
jgi:TPR repeat protein